jgi:hypothetical protein
MKANSHPTQRAEFAARVEPRADAAWVSTSSWYY